MRESYLQNGNLKIQKDFIDIAWEPKVSYAKAMVHLLVNNLPI